jgi:small basic protein
VGVLVLYCTTILGLVYIHAAHDPVKYQPFLGIAVVAKLWGVAACIYAAVGYPWLLLVGVYDIAYGICFFVLYRRIAAAPAKVVIR